MDGPEQWGAVAVEGPEAWGARAVENSGPEAWGATELRAPAIELPVFEPPEEHYMPTPEEAKRWGSGTTSEGLGFDSDEPLLPLGKALIKEPGRAKTKLEEGANQVLRGTLDGLTTPKNLGLMLGSMGVAATGPTMARLVSAIWAGVMGKQAVQNAPVLAEQVGNELGKPEAERDYTKVGSGLAQLGVDGLFFALPAVHLVGAKAAQAIGRKLGLNIESDEFRAPAREPAEEPGAGREEPNLPPPSGQPGAENAAPEPNVSDVLSRTVPETPKTLEAQFEWLKEGKRKAVLVPNETIQQQGMPAIPEGMASHPTRAGTFIFDPAKVQPADIDVHVGENRVGELLDYGIPDKPAEASAVVTVRGSDGLEKQAVVTDQANLMNVLEAAKRMAGEGDTVQVEPAEKVIEERLRAQVVSPGEVRIPASQPAAIGAGRLSGDQAGPVRVTPEQAADTGTGRLPADSSLAAATPGADAGAAPSADPILTWLDKAIEELDPLKRNRTLEGITGAPIWIVEGAARGALQAVKLAYTTTRDIGRAIAAGIEHLRALNLKDFNETEARRWLKGWGERATGQRILASDAISEQTKQLIGEYLYQRRSNATDMQQAAGIVRDRGVEEAVKIFKNPPQGLPSAVRFMMPGVILDTLAVHERQARAGGDLAGAEKLSRQQAEIADDVLPRTTDLGQGLQALRNFIKLSPDGQVAWVKRKFEQAAGEAIAARQDEVGQVLSAIEDGRAAGIERFKHDLQVNNARSAAVDEAVSNHPAVNKAIIMEMAEPFASSTEIMKDVRGKAQTNVNALLNKGRPGRPRQQHLREILRDLNQRAATIFAGHMQGAEPGVHLVDKLMQRLGLERSEAVRWATGLTQEWARQLEAAKAAIPKRLARQRVARERAAAGGLPEGAPDRLVDAAIRKHLRDLDIRWDQVIRQETARQDATGQHVAERIVQASGLTGEKADTLRTTAINRFNTLVTGAQVAKLEALQKGGGKPLSRPIKSAFEKLSELSRLGALTSERFYDVVKDQLKLKRLTAEEAARIRELVQKAQARPEGYLRDRAAGELMKYNTRLQENIYPKLVLEMFYANILSGPVTLTKMLFENADLYVFNTIAELVANPRANLLHPIDFARTVGSASTRGLKIGGAHLADVMRTGIRPDMRPGALEMSRWGMVHKYVIRAVSAADVLAFEPAWELKQALIAREVARREGLTGQAKQQRVADLLANTQTAVAKARAQAQAELRELGYFKERQAGESSLAYNGRVAAEKLDLQRRTTENVRAAREVNMPGSSARSEAFALRSTYLNEPYGLSGALANGAQRLLESARRESPILGGALKTQIPFIRIVANVLSERLNWTPYGIGRAAVSHLPGKFHGKLYGRPMLEGERAALYAKGIVGTIALGATAYFLAEHIHGNGPSSPQKRKQLLATGWIPNSFQWNDKYYSYMNTPAALGLALIGNWQDWQRYGNGDEADGLTRVAFVGKTLLSTIISQGFLDSVKRLFEAIGSESSTAGADKLQKLMARTASSLVIPNAVQQVDRFFDPKAYDKTGMEALVKGQIPFVRRSDKPALTVLGDPVEAGPFHYWVSKLTDDSLLRMLAEKQAWVPEPGRSQFIGDKKRGPDHYRALTADEYYDFIEASGSKIRRRLQSQLGVLSRSSPEKAQAIVRAIAEEEHAAAKQKFERSHHF